MKTPIRQQLEFHGIHPSAQRLAVGDYVLSTAEHPSAERVFEMARERLATISQATVYNTLNLFVERGLLKALQIEPGHTVFDPNVDPHHHFIDHDSGRIHDIPWDAVQVNGTDQLDGFDVAEVQLILRGRRQANPDMNFLFENKLTMQWQIQEMIRVEGIATEHGVALEIEGQAPAKAMFIDTQFNEARVSSVQFIRIPLSAAQRAAFGDLNLTASFRVDHPCYRATTPISGPTRGALIDDMRDS